eukprot:CAMPEP_0202466536 /NCGR_PEP_ID=MMETSP1360-20130828/69095_1 /ASSEMBLY_ACC=CAM_ASM_000848 /TAXON_ID=515479 /ORGANISM="Licmophora paradoxa, Strain CCMP2313" /LENGTH=153 /DNA_ID=CAMNT_0049090707 /DNA_START=135 /DNA_END=593 /DNA_ORIENTATION=+
MRRIWRPHAPLREKVCGKLENHDLTEDYIAFSVRRGDKKELEHFEYQDLQDYIVRAEEEITAVFNGTVPKIFVATDDCTVMPEFQKLRPTWTFVSQCDNNDDTGFALYDVMDWTIEQTDAHFEKFMIELYGLAMGRVFIGVSYTNVAWWVYFM